jgi:hypothetical protein
MAYALTYNGIEGQAGLYSRIQRLLDGKWWDETGSAWVAAQSAACDVALTESAILPGQYSALAGIIPARGGVYLVAVYTAAGVLLMQSECPNMSGQRTVLEIINNVQKELRLPQTGEVAFPISAHAQLLLGFINKTMDLMMEHSPSSSLKTSGRFQTIAGMAYYQISPVNATGGIDMVSRLQIPGSYPLSLMSDDQMKAYKDSCTEQNQPGVFRLHSRQGGALIIEVAPTPDAAYSVDFNGLLRVVSLTASTDIPLLDADTIQLGVLWMAKQDQGEEFQVDLAAFQAKISLHNPTGSIAGDVEFI